MCVFLIRYKILDKRGIPTNMFSSFFTIKTCRKCLGEEPLNEYSQLVFMQK